MYTSSDSMCVNLAIYLDVRKYHEPLQLYMCVYRGQQDTAMLMIEIILLLFFEQAITVTNLAAHQTAENLMKHVK